MKPEVGDKRIHPFMDWKLKDGRVIPIIEVCTAVSKDGKESTWTWDTSNEEELWMAQPVERIEAK